MDDRIGIVGLGRFGGALSRLCEDAGLEWRGLDPGAPPDEEHAAPSLAALADASDILIVAVPVPRIESTLRALRPSLRSNHLVMDVGSVKTGPAESLATVLGDRCDWVPTHPLFGPVSLARGERPRDVVVCASRERPGAAARARAFWRRLDCEPVDETPETHDRVMALTHALAFFVAKGLLAVGAGEGAAFAPPSFRAIRHTIEAVRADAGHLFGAIHAENPFASDARSRLLDALTRIDASLRLPSRADAEDREAAQAAVAIPPGRDAVPHALLETRARIDELDRELVALLARRAELSRRAARAKAGTGRTIRDPSREVQALADRVAWGARAGLDADAVMAVFAAVFDQSRKVQES
jgi:prephenate dehydrogenase